MTRDEMITKMTRFYSTRHVMLQGGYITLTQFMSELLDMQEKLDMLPPSTDNEEDAIVSIPVFDGGIIVDRVRHGWDKPKKY